MNWSLTAFISHSSHCYDKYQTIQLRNRFTLDHGWWYGPSWWRSKGDRSLAQLVLVSPQVGSSEGPVRMIHSGFPSYSVH